MWVVSSCSICLISLLAFPSPCGVWVVSRGGGVMTVYIAGFRPLAGCGLFLKTYMVAIQGQVSVPLRGVGCFQSITNMIIALTSFRPLAGCGLFPGVDGEWQLLAQKFPSPCGVWVVSSGTPTRHSSPIFPSPCGVWVVSYMADGVDENGCVSVPLRGVGCFPF